MAILLNLHTAELGFSPLQSRAHRLHEVIGTQHYAIGVYRLGILPFIFTKVRLL